MMGNKKKWSINILIFCAVIFNLQPVLAKHLYSEKTYQKHWCSQRGGKLEVILFDKARVDCLTSTHAIEFDFASKWGESIGQSLYYAAITNKKPGIVLILENPAQEQRYLDRVKTVAANHGITVWTMSPGDLCIKKVSMKKNKR